MKPTIVLTERETRPVEQANASGRTPVVFIHDLWLGEEARAAASAPKEARRGRYGERG